MKNQKLQFISFALAAALCGPWPARAAYDDVGISPRAVGMSNAFTAVADDVYAIYYNPAGLAALDRPEFAASYAKLMTGLSDNSNIQNSFLAYEHPIKDGRQGVAGVALNYFSLMGLYQEISLFGSYGRDLFAERYPDRFYGGLNLKVLNRSVTPGSAANQPLDNNGALASGVDSVLQHTSKTNLDADLGLLWKVRPRWSLGFMAQHLFEPNIAFSSNDTDKLGRNVKLGAAYRTPFSTLALDVDFPTAPDGSIDKTAAIAAEKWLPTLMFGTFGLRGSLAAGTRDYRQIGVGASYKIYRMQFDYGFTIPLGGLATSGSHRVGLIYRFGGARVPEAQRAEIVLEHIRELAEVGSPEFTYKLNELAQFKRSAIDEQLRQAQVNVGFGRFAEAVSKLDAATALKPGDARMAESRNRLNLVASVYPEIDGFFTDPGRALLYEGALKFLSGRDEEALADLVYAQSRMPSDGRIEAMIKAVEAKSGLGRQALAAASVSAEARAKQLILQGYGAMMEVALRQFEYDKVIQLGRQMTELDNANVLAFKRMATAYRALKRNREALSALESALKFEKDAQARDTLRSYAKALEAEISSAQAALAVRPPALTPLEIERLYETGVDLYSAGRLPEAAEAFRRILESDPKNASSLKALRRVEAEMLQSGEQK